MALAILAEPGRGDHRRVSLVHPRRPGRFVLARFLLEPRGHGVLSLAGYSPIQEGRKTLCGSSIKIDREAHVRTHPFRTKSVQAISHWSSNRSGQATSHWDTADLRLAIRQGLGNFVRRSARLLRGDQLVQGDDIEEFWALRDVSFDVVRGEVLESSVATARARARC